jgi:hypothetical protein
VHVELVLGEYRQEGYNYTKPQQVDKNHKKYDKNLF